MKSKGGLTVLAVLAIAAIAAPPANAGFTRAEYVVQVDPLCLAASQQESKAFIGFNKAFKEFKREKKTRRNLNRFIRKGAKFFGLISRVETNLNARISAIPLPTTIPPQPAGTDEGKVTAWLQKRGEAIGYLNRGIVALKHHKLRVFLGGIDQFLATLEAADSFVADFGFKYCVG